MWSVAQGRRNTHRSAPAPAGSARSSSPIRPVPAPESIVLRADGCIRSSALKSRKLPRGRRQRRPRSAPSLGLGLGSTHRGFEFAGGRKPIVLRTGKRGRRIGARFRQRGSPPGIAGKEAGICESLVDPRNICAQALERLFGFSDTPAHGCELDTFFRRGAPYIGAIGARVGALVIRPRAGRAAF